jgi:cytoskeletal protein RodZ
METIGHILKKTRESRALTIDQVNKKTRIHTEVLVALEEGRCDQMLSYTYAKSFLKKYCDFLGLNPAEILTEYPQARQEKLGDKPMQLRPSELKKDAPKEKKPSIIPIKQDVKPTMLSVPPSEVPENLLKLARMAGIIILVIIVLLGIGFVGKKIVKAVKGKGHGKLVYTTQPRSAVAKASPKKEASLKEVSIPKDVLISVTLKTKRSVLVKVRRDGVLVMDRVLPKGMHESFKASDKLEIYAAKGEAIDIYINGKSLGSPGKGLKNIEITRKGMKVR